jgi:hypothetical protein
VTRGHETVTTEPDPDDPFSGDPTAGDAEILDPKAAAAERRRLARAERKRVLPHGGTTIEASVAALNCHGPLCSADQLATAPGVRLDGFIGGNIRGWVELGVTGGWGKMGSRVESGGNVMSMFGLDSDGLTDMLADQGLGGFATQGFAIRQATLKTADVGPMARVHFNPAGRLLAWVGSGVTYHLLRNDFGTDGGPIRVDFHGIAIPLEAGLGVAVHRNFAVVAKGSYAWTRSMLTTINMPDDALTVPTRMLQDEAAKYGMDVVAQLPALWTVGLGVRTRF